MSQLSLRETPPQWKATVPSADAICWVGGFLINYKDEAKIAVMQDTTWRAFCRDSTTKVEKTRSRD